MDQRALAFAIVGLGVAAVVLGLLIASGGLSWFGRLPGDIRVESEHVRLYIPITSMILVSVALSLALYAINRLLGR